jgi:lysophospholipase L1-like esterase
VYQLRERWELECLAIQPDVVSILIGVNDFWHTLSSGYKGTVEVYENDYRALLKYTKEKLPNVQFVIGEPFALKGGTAIEEANWYPAFDAYRKVAAKLADEFKAVFVPYQAGFDAAVKQAPVRYWSNDGVHPDLPGRQLMANIWLEATGLK